MMPLVSIVIPVFNGSNYLTEAIESALAQTYDNIEIIVIDDGSNDGGKTEAIIKSYGNAIRHLKKANGGCGSALNLGLMNMNGEYFSWLSHDDRYLPNKIERQVYLAERQAKGDKPIIYCGYNIIDGYSRQIASVPFDRHHSIQDLNTPLYPVVKNLMHGCGLLIHRKWIEKVGLFNEKLLHTQDYDYWFRLMRIAPIHFDGEILIESRTHSEQTTFSLGQKRECNQFWSEAIQNINDEEIASLRRSPYIFYKSMEVQFKKAKLYEVKRLAKELSLDFYKKNKLKSIFEYILFASSNNFIVQNLKNILSGDFSVKWIVLKIREDGVLLTIKKFFSV